MYYKNYKSSYSEQELFYQMIVFFQRFNKKLVQEYIRMNLGVSGEKLTSYVQDRYYLESSYILKAKK